MVKKTTQAPKTKTQAEPAQIKANQLAIRQRVTEAMVKALTEGTPPWRQPWQSWGGGASLTSPLNFHSQRHYRGINPLLLLFASMTKGHTSPYWGTQAAWAKDKQAQPRKGEEPTYVVFFTLVPVIENGKKKKNAKGQDVMFPLMRQYPLYNADQMEAPPGKLDKYRLVLETRNVEPNFAPADALIEATNAEIVYRGLRACYEGKSDKIMCPPRKTFDSAADFYETIFHELVHWTEHPKRVGQRKGHQYAFGELVAEIGACMLLLEIGVPMADKMLESSKPYVKAWAERMGNDPKFIFDAASQAGKAIDYILAFRPKEKKRRGAA